MLSHETRALTTMSARRRGSLTDHLASSDGFARLADHAERLHRLQTLLDAMLPINLAPAVRVANFKRGKVVIHADSGAVAVKLRQLGPRLVAGLVQQGQEVSGIEVRVQAGGRFSPPQRKIQPKKLGLRAKRSLTSLASGLPGDSPLKAAIERLLRSARS
ncbi:MAG: DciA family protein [Rhodocyclaceae bacterium]